jgi:hypothetical protein
MKDINKGVKGNNGAPHSPTTIRPVIVILMTLEEISYSGEMAG